MDQTSHQQQQQRMPLRNRTNVADNQINTTAAAAAASLLLNAQTTTASSSSLSSTAQTVTAAAVGAMGSSIHLSQQFHQQQPHAHKHQIYPFHVDPTQSTGNESGSSVVGGKSSSPPPLFSGDNDGIAATKDGNDALVVLAASPSTTKSLSSSVGKGETTLNAAVKASAKLSSPLSRHHHLEAVDVAFPVAHQFLLLNSASSFSEMLKREALVEEIVEVVTEMAVEEKAERGMQQLLEMVVGQQQQQQQQQQDRGEEGVAAKLQSPHRSSMSSTPPPFSSPAVAAAAISLPSLASSSSSPSTASCFLSAAVVVPSAIQSESASSSSSSNINDSHQHRHADRDGDADERRDCDYDDSTTNSRRKKTRSGAESETTTIANNQQQQQQDPFAPTPFAPPSNYFTSLSIAEQRVMGRALFVDPSLSSSSSAAAASSSAQQHRQPQSQCFDPLLEPTAKRLNPILTSRDGSRSSAQHNLTPDNVYDAFGLWHQYLQALLSVGLTREMVRRANAMAATFNGGGGNDGGRITTSAASQAAGTALTTTSSSSSLLSERIEELILKAIMKDYHENKDNNGKENWGGNEDAEGGGGGEHNANDEQHHHLRDASSSVAAFARYATRKALNTIREYVTRHAAAKVFQLSRSVISSSRKGNVDVDGATATSDGDDDTHNNAFYGVNHLRAGLRIFIPTPWGVAVTNHHTTSSRNSEGSLGQQKVITSAAAEKGSTTTTRRRNSAQTKTAAAATTDNRRRGSSATTLGANTNTSSASASSASSASSSSIRRYPFMSALAAALAAEQELLCVEEQYERLMDPHNPLSHLVSSGPSAQIILRNQQQVQQQQDQSSSAVVVPIELVVANAAAEMALKRVSEKKKNANNASPITKSTAAAAATTSSLGHLSGICGCMCDDLFGVHKNKNQNRHGDTSSFSSALLSETTFTTHYYPTPDVLVPWGKNEGQQHQQQQRSSAKTTPSHLSTNADNGGENEDVNAVAEDIKLQFWRCNCEIARSIRYLHELQQLQQNSANDNGSTSMLMMTAMSMNTNRLNMETDCLVPNIPAASAMLLTREASEKSMLSFSSSSATSSSTTVAALLRPYLSPFDVVHQHHNDRTSSASSASQQQHRRAVVSSTVTMANYLYVVCNDEVLAAQYNAINHYGYRVEEAMRAAAAAAATTTLSGGGVNEDHQLQQQQQQLHQVREEAEMLWQQFNDLVSERCKDHQERRKGRGKGVAIPTGDASLPLLPLIRFVACADLPRAMSDPSLLFVAQQDLRPTMRLVLCDWLTEVAVKYKLKDETFFLATAIIDRYLSTTCEAPPQTRVAVSRHHLQLVGSAAMMIAAKFEEIYPPSTMDFVHITDRAFSLSELLAMERSILAQLDYKLSFPSVLFFAQMILSHASGEVHSMMVANTKRKKKTCEGAATTSFQQHRQAHDEAEEEQYCVGVSSAVSKSLFVLNNEADHLGGGEGGKEDHRHHRPLSHSEIRRLILAQKGSVRSSSREEEKAKANSEEGDDVDGNIIHMSSVGSSSTSSASSSPSSSLSASSTNTPPAAIAPKTTTHSSMRGGGCCDASSVGVERRLDMLSGDGAHHHHHHDDETDHHHLHKSGEGCSNSNNNNRSGGSSRKTSMTPRTKRSRDEEGDGAGNNNNEGGGVGGGGFGENTTAITSYRQRQQPLRNYTTLFFSRQQHSSSIDGDDENKNPLQQRLFVGKDALLYPLELATRSALMADGKNNSVSPLLRKILMMYQQSNATSTMFSSNNQKEDGSKLMNMDMNMSSLTHQIVQHIGPLKLSVSDVCSHVLNALAKKVINARRLRRGGGRLGCGDGGRSFMDLVPDVKISLTMRTTTTRRKASPQTIDEDNDNAVVTNNGSATPQQQQTRLFHCGPHQHQRDVSGTNNSSMAAVGGIVGNLSSPSLVRAAAALSLRSISRGRGGGRSVSKTPPTPRTEQQAMMDREENLLIKTRVVNIAIPATDKQHQQQQLQHHEKEVVKGEKIVFDVDEENDNAVTTTAASPSSSSSPSLGEPSSIATRLAERKRKRNINHPQPDEDEGGREERETEDNNNACTTTTTRTETFHMIADEVDGREVGEFNAATNGSADSSLCAILSQASVENVVSCVVGGILASHHIHQHNHDDDDDDDESNNNGSSSQCRGGLGQLLNEYYSSASPTTDNNNDEIATGNHRSNSKNDDKNNDNDDYLLTSQLASGTHLEHSLTLYLAYLVTVRCCYGEIALPSTVACAIVGIARLWAGEVLFSEVNNSDDGIAHSPSCSLSSSSSNVDRQLALIFPTAAVRDAAGHIASVLMAERDATATLVDFAHGAFESCHSQDDVWLEGHFAVTIGNFIKKEMDSLIPRTMAAADGSADFSVRHTTTTTPTTISTIQAEASFKRWCASHKINTEALPLTATTDHLHQQPIIAINRLTTPHSDTVMHRVTDAISDAQDFMSEEIATYAANSKNSNNFQRDPPPPPLPKTGVFMKFISRRYDSVSLLPVPSIVANLAKLN